MWLLINPKLNPRVPKTKVKELFQAFFHVAVTQRLSNYLSFHDSGIVVLAAKGITEGEQYDYL